MITSSCWIPKGSLNESPKYFDKDLDDTDKFNFLEKKLDKKKKKIQCDTSADDILNDECLKKYNLENYDDDYDIDDPFSNILPIITNNSFSDSEDDDYLKHTNEDELEEKEELKIYPNDSLIISTRSEDDFNYLDIYVYDQGEEFEKTNETFLRPPSLYIHHDILLPEFPLCCEYINLKKVQDETNTNETFNYAAIGTFNPEIELWNLDYLNKSTPDLVLGDNKIKKKKKSSKHVTTHHVDSVLSLSHNKLQCQILASTSKDHTIKIWDLCKSTAIRSLNKSHFNSIVSSSKWSFLEPSILLSGGYDGSVGISDVRVSDKENVTKNYQTTQKEEVECVNWAGYNNPEMFISGTEKGNVFFFDFRNTQKPLWVIHAHDNSISSISNNYNVNGILVTSAINESKIKLWKYSTNPLITPINIVSRSFNINNVLSTSFCGDSDLSSFLAICGTSSKLKIWDIFSNSFVHKSYFESLGNSDQLQNYNLRMHNVDNNFSKTEIVLQVDDKDSDELISE